MNSITTNTETKLDNFWRNKVTWRTTSKGMNKYVIRKLNPYADKDKAIQYMRGTILSNKDIRRYIDENDNTYNKHFKNIVNDCLNYIWHGEQGYVFTDEQLYAVMDIIPDVKVSYSKEYDCYRCWVLR